MELPEFDMKGEFHLLKEGGRRDPLHNGHWCHANIKGVERQDSCGIFFHDRPVLNLGETCPAGWKFLFRNSDGFEIEVSTGQVFEVNEGPTKIGEFKVLDVLNEKIKKN
jgi:hypothetical protein